MNIITVIPLTRSKVAETLSYFTKEDVPVGAVVSVPLRSKSIHGIVTETMPAEMQKSDLKNLPFAIRKLNKVKATSFFPATFISAAAELADYYATTIGAVIRSLMSESILENASKILPPLPPQASLPVASKFSSGIANNIEQTFAVQGDDSDRVSSWRSLIRQEFARKRSVIFHVPSIDDVKRLASSLEKGIEGYIFPLHGGLTEKKIAEIWARIAETAHPIVVVATGSFSLVPRGDIDTVVIERENGRGWISQKSPYLDLRHALELAARKRRQTVFLADSLLRTETLERLDNREIEQGSPFKWRSISTAEDLLVDMKKGPGRRTEQSVSHWPTASKPPAPSDAPSESSESSEQIGSRQEKPKFRVFSPELESLIKRNREDSTHLFLMCVRRGMSPTTVCSDCETIVVCKNCSAPVVLHTSGGSGKNYFMCHKCGERRSADENCANCGGWKLTPLGIGIDRVAEELKERFPDAEVFKMDADTTKTDKQIADVLEKFRARPGSILLGTEMALPHLEGNVDHVAVVSLDSLLALPDFRIHEKIMYTIVRLRATASRSFLVQTRRAEESVFDFGMKGNLSDFHRSAKAERKQFNYPPFSILVKITLEGKKDKISAGMQEIQRLLEPCEIDIFPAFTATVRRNSLIHGLIKIEPNRWPDMDLIRKLRTLGPGVSVKVNPESLL